MKKLQTPELGPVAQQAFHLSEHDPIEAHMHTYAQNLKKPLFDMHYELELGILVNGRMRRFYQDGQNECAKGDIWFCGMWEPHGFDVLETPCRALVLVLWPPLLANLFFPEAPHIQWMAPFAVPYNKRPRIKNELRDNVLSLAWRIQSLIEAPGKTKALRLRFLLLELLLMLQEKASTSEKNPVKSVPQEYKQISPAIELVFDSHSLITNETAAKLCRMSRDQFIRQFRRLMGITFAKFALRYRMSRAAEQLLSTNNPVKAIAREWGFTDESHLHRVFVNHYGHSPVAYRKRLQESSD